MGTLLRLLLRFFGYRPSERAYLTPVSKTIDLLPSKKSRRWLIGGLLHFVPVAVGLVVVFVLRRREITHTWQQVASLCLAAMWSFLGPASIWYYERYVLPRLNKNCRQRLSDSVQRRRMQRRIYSPIMHSRASRVIIGGWVLTVSVVFVNSARTLEGYGIGAVNDPLWWLLFAGVVMYAFYSALGVSFASRSLRLIHLLSWSTIRQDLYHRDGVMGFSFVGEYALATFLLFATGWLFVPALVIHAPDTNAFYLLVVGYSGFLLFVFLFPIVSIHRTIVRAKAEIASPFRTRASAALKELGQRYDDKLADVFELDRTVVSDTHLVREWPVGVDVFVRFLLSVIFFPVFVGLVVVWLGGQP
jgi:hypothetical protein